MGKKNDALMSYLEDNGRFADLFNQVYFDGRQVVDPGELIEASQVYNGKPSRKSSQRIRDIKKRLKSGKELKILAVEAQNTVNYIMPWRLMEYDCREYGRQIDGIRRANREASKAGKKGIYANAGEMLGEFRKIDKIAPVYTICLYHGEKPWDGPRSLQDMVDFDAAALAEGWKDSFADYPMRLICANEPMDCSVFRTSLKEVFRLLPYRNDRKGLQTLLQEEAVYSRMDEETAETVSVLMGIKIFMDKKETYKGEEGYNMCQALREMMEESRLEGEEKGKSKGKIEGRIEGIKAMIQDNRNEGVNDKRIIEKLQLYFSMSKSEAQAALKEFTCVALK